MAKIKAQHRPKPAKPLKILTIDGGELQAISTLLILDNLLDTIARNNGVSDKKPRPCDVLDTIAGIGPGGWLALFLGRFHMDIASCLTEWYNLTQIIPPRTKTEGVKIQIFQHCYYLPERLVEQIDLLTKTYGTGDRLYYTNSNGPRCKHVFVAALNTHRGAHVGYNLFRTYEAPTGTHVLKGPEQPSRFKISSAFGVTGAAEYFTPPWTESILGAGNLQFFDTKFPKPHKITELALDEMWALYGVDVEISVIVNIGPGLPIQLRYQGDRSERARSPTLQEAGLRQKQFALGQPEDVHSGKLKDGLHVQFGKEAIQRNSLSRDLEASERTMAITRSGTYGSERDRGVEIKLRRLETELKRISRRS
ncbi:hypothetical protein MMC13_004037 [Lambiella insularis]|nr:hypothetical protein [Lambiella insularis]